MELKDVGAREGPESLPANPGDASLPLGYGAKLERGVSDISDTLPPNSFLIPEFNPCIPTVENKLPVT